jgi:hypothetical protein
MEIRWASFRIHKVPIHPRLVDPIELALIAKQIGLPQ